MKAIITPIDKGILKKELSSDKFLRPTNKAHNEIYVITAHDSPNVMQEIGRLRELSFRTGGGGTGEEIDTDYYDYMDIPYKQLIVWDPVAEEIIGGYRYLAGRDTKLDTNRQPVFVMSHLFHFSENFISAYLPYTIELGRAFVQPDYQTSKMGTKSLFALDNLWDGLGALIHIVPDTRYFIGKVTIYEHYPILARELIYNYLFRYYPDPDQLIIPKKPIEISVKANQLASSLFVNTHSNTDYKILQKAVRAQGDTIPPLFNAYIGLTDTMRFFGATQDPDFGSVYEAGIMITTSDLFESKRMRYIEPYIDYLKHVFEERHLAKRLAKEMKLEQKKAMKADKTLRKKKK